MEAFYILFAPLCWLIVAKIWLHTSINWTEFGINVVVIVILTTATIQISKWGATSDTEVWNGQVTKKEIVDDYYQTSYDCNCSNTYDSKGNVSGETCQTCYTDHYTREYNGHSTVGNWTFASIDSEWRMRRDSFGPPASYTKCKVGEPASIEHGYTNYVQAVPDSLFHDDGTTASEAFLGQIPAYPRVHDFYRINRVLNVGSTVTAAEVKDINTKLNYSLKSLGVAKQANIVLILTNIADPTYRYAIEQAWLGGEKNDIVLFIGLDGNKIVWADVMTWALNSGNELFHVKMRDGLMAQETLNENLVPYISQTILAHYDRPQMKDYEYLADEIEVPTWVLILASVFAFGGSVLGTYLSHKHDLQLR